MYLLNFDNPSVYIRNLIDKDRLEKENPEFLKILQQQKKLELQEIEKKLKNPSIGKEKIQECLQYWHDVFENKNFLDEKELERAIEKRVLPNVKKLGYKGTSQDIAQLFLNWPEESH